MYQLNRIVSVGVAPATTNGSYNSNNVVGGLLSFQLFAGAACSGIFSGVTIINANNVNAPGTLWVFGRQPQVFNDNTTFAPSVSDLQHVIATYSIASFTAANGIGVHVINDKNVHFVLGNGTLYMYYVLTSAATFTSTQGMRFRAYAYLI